MLFEFIIRDLDTFEDIRKNPKVPSERFDFVKSEFERELLRLGKKFVRYNCSTLVLLINKLDDNGHFVEVVQ